MKRLLIYLMVLCSVVLSGCSDAGGLLRSVIFDKAEIKEDKEYIEYKSLLDNGRLADNGEITDAEHLYDKIPVDSHTDKIHATFAENRYLKITYYLNEERTNKIDTTDCYLNPGDTIYAQIQSTNKISNMYGLSHFLITEYSDDSRIKSQIQQPMAGNLVYCIPIDFKGKELSIAPIGKYSNRKLSLQSYYLDDGEKRTLGNAGRWYINDEPCTGNSAEISPIVSYALKYEFDSNNYFYVSSDPSCFTKDPNSVGLVEFWSADPTVGKSNYSVQLHPFLALSINTEEKASLQLNDSEKETIKKGKSWSNEKLKFGDVIVVETKKGCTISGDYQHIHVDKDPIVGGYRYTLSVTPEKNSASLEALGVNEYISITLPPKGNYGVCSYLVDKVSAKGTIKVQTNQELTITYRITDTDYKFSNDTIIENAWNWGQDLIGNMTKSATIQLSPEMDNKTLNPDEWFSIVKKGA